MLFVFVRLFCRAQRSGAAGLCPCNAHWSKHELRIAERQLRQASRRRVKEERLHKKQKKLSRKLAMALTHDGQCSYEKMNCFSHDNDHWKTAPLWNDGILLFFTFFFLFFFTYKLNYFYMKKLQF